MAKERTLPQITYRKPKLYWAQGRQNSAGLGRHSGRKVCNSKRTMFRQGQTLQDSHRQVSGAVVRGHVNKSCVNMSAQSSPRLESHLAEPHVWGSHTLWCFNHLYQILSESRGARHTQALKGSETSPCYPHRTRHPDNIFLFGTNISNTNSRKSCKNSDLVSLQLLRG